MSKKIVSIFLFILFVFVIYFPKSEAENILRMTEAEAGFHLFIFLIFLPVSLICFGFGISKRLCLVTNSKMIYVSGIAIMLSISKTMHPDRDEHITLLFKVSLFVVFAIIVITIWKDENIKKWLEKNGSDETN